MVNTNVLNMQYCRILDRAERLDAKDIPVADAKEILWIEEEIHARLLKVIGHDFYPVSYAEEEPPKTELEVSAGRKIKFPVTVTSSVGTMVATFTVSANTKTEADLLAREQIRNLGLRKVSHKLS